VAGKPFHLSVVVDGAVVLGVDRVAAKLSRETRIKLNRTHVVGKLLVEAVEGHGIAVAGDEPAPKKPRK